MIIHKKTLCSLFFMLIGSSLCAMDSSTLSSERVEKLKKKFPLSTWSIEVNKNSFCLSIDKHTLFMGNPLLNLNNSTLDKNNIEGVLKQVVDLQILNKATIKAKFADKDLHALFIENNVAGILELYQALKSSEV